MLDDAGLLARAGRRAGRGRRRRRKRGGALQTRRSPTRNACACGLRSCSSCMPWKKAARCCACPDSVKEEAGTARSLAEGGRYTIAGQRTQIVLEKWGWGQAGAPARKAPGTLRDRAIPIRAEEQAEGRRKAINETFAPNCTALPPPVPFTPVPLPTVPVT